MGYLRQDITTGLFDPIEGVTEGPAEGRHPVETDPTTGLINPSLLPDNYDPCIACIAGESLDPWDVCCFYVVGDVRYAKKATPTALATLGTGYVRYAATIGEPVALYNSGELSVVNDGSFKTNHVGKTAWLSSTIPGTVTLTKPADGSIPQRILFITAVSQAVVRGVFVALSNPDGLMDVQGGVGVDQIVDASAQGRSLLQAGQPADARTLLGVINFSGAYPDLSDKPTLGTAAAMDAAKGNTAAADELVLGADPRLSDARTPVGHTHTTNDLTDSSALGRALVASVDAASARALLGAGTPTDYIGGLGLQWDSTTGITIQPGLTYIPALSTTLTVSSAISLASLSLTASTWYHVYLYSNSGTAAAEVSTTAPAAAYLGTARTKTGDTSRRYLGSILTNASSQIYRFKTNPTGNLLDLIWVAQNNVSPFRLLANGTSTTVATFPIAALRPCDAITHLTAGCVLYSATSVDVSAGVGSLDSSATYPELSADIYARAGLGTTTYSTCFYLPPTKIMVPAGATTLQYLMRMSSGSGANLCVDARGITVGR